jgi:23S rRNA pseudouridine2605 synthase
VKVSEKRVGLARALSKLGVCSRSQAAEAIRQGQVRVNGAARRDAEYGVHLGHDRIEVDGDDVQAAAKIYLMLNKPRGLVTTAADEKGRPTIYSLLGKSLPWVGPVGRLDKASEGLLLLTNDSEWGAMITAPETHLPKIYHVQVACQVSNELLGEIARGKRTDEGDFLRVKSTEVLRRGDKNSWLEIVLEEGKNRQIRRLLEGFEVKVLRLIRVAIGPLQLGKLAKGDYRRLSVEEKLELDAAMKRRKR